jgi:hypothetical protein
VLERERGARARVCCCSEARALTADRTQRLDLNFGLEAGYAARDATRYFGLFLRLGVAFGDPARHA